VISGFVEIGSMLIGAVAGLAVSYVIVFTFFFITGKK